MEAVQNASVLYKCQRCGRQSPIKAAFSLRKRLDGSLARCLCFECESKRSSNITLLMYILIPLAGLLILLVNPGSRLGHFYLLLFAGLLASIPLIFLHELSHAVVAHMLGFRVFAIHIGLGKVLVFRRLFNINWTIRLVPSNAVTVIAGPEMDHYRTRIFLIHLAGPLFHALAIALLLWANRNIGVSGIWQTVLLWTNIYLLVFNLYPQKTKTQVAVGSAGTDGWAMLNAPRLSEADLRNSFASFYILATVSAVESGNIQEALNVSQKGNELFPGNPNVLNALGYAYVNANQYHESRQTFLKALSSSGELPIGTKALLMNNVAFANIMLDDPGLLPQADTFSEQAYLVFPWDPAIGGTRGGVLVALDRVEEGIEMLKGALRNNIDRRGKAIDACLLAWGEWKRANPRIAKTYLTLARELDPDCTLLERILAEMLPGT